MGGPDDPAATAPAARRQRPVPDCSGRLPAGPPVQHGPSATTSTVAPTTTTRPPVTDAERAWVAGVARLRRRIDRVVRQSDVVLTQRLLREYIAALRSCTPGLARLGPPTGRLGRPPRSPRTPAVITSAAPPPTGGSRRCWLSGPRARSVICYSRRPSVKVTAATGFAGPRLRRGWRWHDPSTVTAEMTSHAVDRGKP
jgi:hypothetical protein